MNENEYEQYGFETQEAWDALPEEEKEAYRNVGQDENQSEVTEEELSEVEEVKEEDGN